MIGFFIDRPVFAWVLALVIMLMGALSITTLPISQYPSIAPPAISIQVLYPGASADTVQSAVTQVIEQQLRGIDHLNYFSSTSGSDGSSSAGRRRRTARAGDFAVIPDKRGASPR